MWTKTERKRLLNIDESYIKINDDGTKERLRFVQYQHTPKGMVMCFHDKIRKTNRSLSEIFGKEFGQDECIWECIFNNSKEISTEDVEYYFGFNLTEGSKIGKVVKTVKDIFNGFKI